MAEKRFVKGLFKDTGHLDQPEGSWRHARNMIINDRDGAVSNEAGTKLAGHLGNDPIHGAQNDKVIGTIEVSDDKTIFFVTDVVTGGTPASEIGIYEDDRYEILFNPPIIGPDGKPTNDLNFRETHPIEGTFKIDPKGDLIIYWTDDLNPPRTFNVDRQRRESTAVSQLYGISPMSLDNIDILNLFPYSGPVPHIDISDYGTHQGSVIEGGGLLTAVYYLALAYVDDDFTATNFLTVSNPISIVDDFDSTTPTNKKDGAKEGSQTTKAIKWDISNLNVDYGILRPVVIRSKGEAREAFKLNDVKFTTTTTSILYTGLETISAGSVEEVIIDTIAYDTAKTIQQLDNVLYLGNTSSEADLGFQKYANNIKLRARTTEIKNFDEFYASVDNLESGWGNRPVNEYGGVVQTVDPTKSYRYAPNIFKYKGYMRDEIYAFYIAFIMKDGSTSYAYHIPGREALWNEKEPVDNLNAPDYGGLWQDDIYNISPQYGKRFHWIDSTVDSISGASYNPNQARQMNYWENATEFYPDTSNYEVWNKNGQLIGTAGSIKGLNVRHHHFPSNRNSNMKSIVKSNCRTSNVSTGSAFPGTVYNEAITLFDKNGGSWTAVGGPGNPIKFEFPDTTGAGYINNSPEMQASINTHWDGKHFTAVSNVEVRVKWCVWFEQGNFSLTTKPFDTRLMTNAGGTVYTINSDHNSASPFGTGIGGSCGGAETSFNMKPIDFGTPAYTGVSSGGGSAVISLQAGEQIWLESEQTTSGGTDYMQAGTNNGQIDCGGSNALNDINTCNYNSYVPRCTNMIEFDVRSSFLNVDPEDYADAKISHDVRRLGFDLEDIHIPRSIADKVQGFRIYYANRKHSNRTVLGQQILIPAQRKRALIGICQEALAGTETNHALQALATLQSNTEEFYNMDAFHKNPWDYPVLPHYYETGGPTNPVGPIVTSDYAYDTFSFHDFYLQRTKNSLSPATHIDIQYYVSNLVWNGPGLEQDKRMNTILLGDPTTNTTDPVKVQERWGWDDEQNCYPQLMASSIHIGAHYFTVNGRTQPRLLGQKAKTYLMGDTIFKGEPLGFGAKLFNEFGESLIALKVMDNHAINYRRARSYPNSNNRGYFFDTYGAGAPELEFGHFGSPLDGFAVLVNRLDANGDFVGSPAPNHGLRSQSIMANLKAFKTDVYKSVDSQELVWTGYEVLGDNLEKFVFDGSGNMTGTGNTVDVLPDGIWGGDTFICRHGIAPAVKHSNEEDNANPEKAVHYHIVESTDNINFRHEESEKTMYFPNTPAKTLLKTSGVEDLHHFDNLTYNENYSLDNDIRPAFPLPLRDTLQNDFPTRTHRSAKHDTTSIIDNYRVFLANQFKDLPRNRGELWKLSSFNNLLYFHMQESLFAAQGKQSMQMKDGSDAFIGSGDIFAQEPNELVQTEGGFGGTQSQWAALTTRYGYFFVDQAAGKVFMMKESLDEISKLGMRSWFKENLPFKLGPYGIDDDNPLIRFGFHSTYDSKFKRIILTKREIKPTPSFLASLELFYIPYNVNTGTFLNIRYNPNTNHYEQAGLFGGWSTLLWTNTSHFEQEDSGWTISYYPEMGFWGGFHDYIPYLYFKNSKSFYSLTDKYPRPVTIAYGTTFGNAGIWKHNHTGRGTATTGDGYGVLYQENAAGIVLNQTDATWLTKVNHHPFQFEFIHNEYKGEDTLVSAFNYTMETVNPLEISVLEHGFTSFFLYNTFQMSGEQDLEYLINTRRIGNNWKINKFRDMARLEDQAGSLNLPNTSPYYTATGTNVAGGTNTGTVTTSTTNNMFIYDGMSKNINAAYLNLAKTWDLQKKFIDKWVGIRLIYNNISNNSLNLYATDVVVRKMNR